VTLDREACREFSEYNQDRSNIFAIHKPMREMQGILPLRVVFPKWAGEVALTASRYAADKEGVEFICKVGMSIRLSIWGIAH